MFFPFNPTRYGGLWIAAVCSLLLVTPVRGQDSPLQQGPPRERLLLQNGNQLLGMVLDQSPRAVEFLEINQPPGRPTFAVIHVVPTAQVAQLTRVDMAERQQLEQLADQIRNRTQIRAAEESSLEITVVPSEILNTQQALRYEGDQFVLISGLREDATRSLAVRADQIFQAFQHWLPPTRQPRETIEIILFESLTSYSVYLKKIGLQVDNPAIYVPHANQVLIGSDLQSFQQRLELTQKQHAQLTAESEKKAASLSGELTALAKRLRDAGWPPAEITSEINARREAWQRDYRQKLAQLKVADRRNEAMRQSLMDQTTRHLCHEAFHAYIENFLYPQDEYDVPVWLNEGLAQLFEHAQFENQTFRIDQPPRELLTDLQARLKRDDGFSLQRMLQTEAGSFLLFENLHRSQLDYDVAWGLAWYLVFQKQLLEAKNLERFVQPRRGPTVPLEEKFGQPVSVLQAEWTRFMLRLTL